MCVVELARRRLTQALIDPVSTQTTRTPSRDAARPPSATAKSSDVRDQTWLLGRIKQGMHCYTVLLH